MKCPDCGNRLTEVFQDGKTPLNNLQWEMLRLGDFYCSKCVDHSNMFAAKFFKKEEVQPQHVYQCPVCEALLNTKENKLIRA